MSFKVAHSVPLILQVLFSMIFCRVLRLKLAKGATSWSKCNKMESHFCQSTVTSLCFRSRRLFKLLKWQQVARKWCSRGRLSLGGFRNSCFPCSSQQSSSTRWASFVLLPPFSSYSASLKRRNGSTRTWHISPGFPPLLWWSLAHSQLAFLHWSAYWLRTTAWF